MAKKSIKMRARLKGDVTTVKCLMNHPMETGLRKDKKTGEPIPAHFIQDVVATHNGNEIMNAQWSGGVSKNPYAAFKFKGAGKGDEVSISWTDNKGNSDSAATKIR